MKSSRVENFESLNVYQRARELTNRIYELTRKANFTKDFGLVDQIRRASVSIMSNIVIVVPSIKSHHISLWQMNGTSS